MAEDVGTVLRHEEADDGAGADADEHGSQQRFVFDGEVAVFFGVEHFEFVAAEKGAEERVHLADGGFGVEGAFAGVEAKVEFWPAGSQALRS